MRDKIWSVRRAIARLDGAEDEPRDELGRWTSSGEFVSGPRFKDGMSNAKPTAFGQLARSPIPFASRTEIEEKKFAPAMVKIIPKVDVPLKDIVTDQKGVSPAIVRQYLTASADFGTPPEVYKIGGHYIVNDGNHRVTAAILRGDKTIKMTVLDLNK